MKISIIGTNGFLSTAIAKYANENKWALNMYGVDQPVGHEYDKYYHVNLMETEIDCSTLLDSDIVVYAAGAGIQADLKENPYLIYGLNVTVPIGICNKLKELCFTGRLVTFGSYFEIGEAVEGHLWTEHEILTSLLSAPNDYTVSKRLFSRFVASYKHNYVHWHFFLPTIYGAGENPKRLIPYVVNAIQNDEALHFTTGEQIRQYIHVSEISRIVSLAYQKNLPSGLYNISGNEIATVRTIVEKIHCAMGRNVPLKCFGSVSRADTSMRYLALDGTKLQSYIGKIEYNHSIVSSLETYF